MSQEEEKKGSLRQVMPVAAEIVDWLRQQLGQQAADAIVLKGKAGRGGFYVAEIGPDGVFREFGSTKGGRRCQLQEGRVVWSDVRSEKMPPPSSLPERRARHGA